MELKRKIRRTGSEEKLRQLKSTWRSKKIFSTLLLKQRDATEKKKLCIVSFNCITPRTFHRGSIYSGALDWIWETSCYL